MVSKARKARRDGRKKWRQMCLRLCKNQKWKCYHCGRPMQRIKSGHEGSLRPEHATVEHLKHISQGGYLTGKNAVAACYACNQKTAVEADPDHPANTFTNWSLKA